MLTTRPRGGLPTPASILVLLLAVACPAPARALCRAESLLVSSASFATSFLARTITVADFNGDGILDLAAATTHHVAPHRDAVAVWLGMGNGTFSGPAYYATGSNPVDVVAADFNGDHILDLAALNQTAGSISVLRGQGAGGVGNGTFAPQSVLDTGPVPIQLVAGDFKEDGIMDLAVLHSQFGIRVLAGLATGGIANGSFSTVQNLPVPGTASGNLVASDINRDGILDLVFAKVGPVVAAVYGTGSGGVGNGHFSAPVTFSGNGTFDVADMNGDARSDLVLGGGGMLSIALGTLGGGFQGPGPISPGYEAGPVRVADLDQDGSPDIIAGSGSALVALSGLGSQGGEYDSFDYPAQLSPGFFTQCLALGDFDSDGKPDVVAARLDAVTNDARLEVFLSHCANSAPPILDAVEDVPDDQGGSVHVSWRRSGQDGLAGDAVTAYRVFQRDPGSASWSMVRELPATRQNVYVHNATTAQDATPAGPATTNFYISAITADPGVFYDSAVLDGHSIDNLAPSSPGNFTASLVFGEGIHLAWSAVAVPDFATYHVHRVPLVFLPADPPAAGNRIATTTATEWLDTGAGDVSDVVAYWIAAEDLHGNIGPYAPVQLFTTPCERGSNLVRNNTPELAIRAKPAGAADLALAAPTRVRAPVLKPWDLPEPLVSTFGTTLDTTIVDSLGTGRLVYDLRFGQIHAEARSAANRKTVDVLTTDMYRVLGPASGTSFTVGVELALHAIPVDVCANPPCGGGSAQVAILSPTDRTEVTLAVGAGVASRDTILTLPVPVVAGSPFPLYFDALASTPLSGGGVAVTGLLRFTGLPDGAQVASCGGYANGGAVSVDPAPVATAAPRLSLAAPAFDRSSGRLRLTFTLESNRPATLQLFDLAGRRLAREDVGAFGPGEHQIEMATGRLPAGLLFAMLRQEHRSVTKRTTIVR
jgi:hypothetical protein